MGVAVCRRSRCSRLAAPSDRRRCRPRSWCSRRPCRETSCSVRRRPSPPCTGRTRCPQIRPRLRDSAALHWISPAMGRCCSKLTGRGGGAVFATTCRGATSRAGAVAGACPPRTASLVGTTAAEAIKLACPTAPGETTTRSLRYRLCRRQTCCLGTPVTAPFTLAFS